MKARHRCISWLCVFGWVMLLAPNAHAEGVLYAPQSSVPAPRQEGKVTITIEKQVATTIVEQSYKLSQKEEGVFYLFPTPPNASVVNFELWRGGRWEPAEIRSKEQPKLPGGLADQMSTYLGANPFRITFPHEAGTCKLRLTFVELLPYAKGSVSYSYPLPAYEGIKQVTPTTLALTLRLERKVAQFTSASHSKLPLQKVSDNEWSAQTTLTADDRKKNLKLTYKPQQDGISMRFFAHRDPRWEALTDDKAKMFKDGYFLLMLEPNETVSTEEIIPKIFTLVIDTSGSMSGNKIQEARKAALRCIDGLHEKDQFNIVHFSSTAKSFRPQAVDATASNRRDAKAAVEKLYAGGGTNIKDALLRALQNAPKVTERPHLIIFLTDGRGQNPPDKVIEAVRQANINHARIFAFGVGAGYNRAFLEDLAYATKGKASDISNGNIDAVLGTFFQSINSPVLTDLKIDFGGQNINRVTPAADRLPNVYLGNQLLILGRYDGFQTQNIRITGKIGSQEVNYTVSADFLQQQAQNSFLPRIWAMAYTKNRHSQWLRQNRPDDLKKEITSIGLLYRIQTPFTSFGVQSPEQTNDATANSGTNSGYSNGSNPNYGYAGRASVHGGSGGCACSSQTTSPTPSLPLLLGLLLLCFLRRKSPHE